MKRLMAVVIFLPLITGMRACSWYPSTFFVSLDLDRNGQLSYPEWMTYYTQTMHDHSIGRCSRKDFYLADCNSDDLLTWREYYDFRFKHKSCDSAPVKTLRRRYELDPSLQARPDRAAFQNLQLVYLKELSEKEEQLKLKYGVGSGLN